jgi:hypothetical protein
MKAEERKRLERNELADRLKHAWEGVASTTPKSNRIWTIALAALVIVLIWALYSRYTTGQDISLWARLDTSFDLDQLRSLYKEFPNTTQGRIARYQIARIQFAESIQKVAAQNADDRVAAAKNIEDVRKAYSELVQVTGLPPLMNQEAMLQLARTEEILASVPQTDDAAKMRGTLDQAITYYDELKKKYPESMAGKQAAARAEELRKKKDEVAKLYSELAKDQAKSPPAANVPVGVQPETPSLPAPVFPPVEKKDLPK